MKLVFNIYLLLLFKIYINKSFDVNEVFADVKKSFKEYNSVDSGCALEKIKAWKALSVEVVSGLTDILKNVLNKPE